MALSTYTKKTGGSTLVEAIYVKTTKWHDGEDIEDGMQDGYIYRKEEDDFCVLADYIKGRRLTPYHFGAVGDGVTNDTPAFQRWIDFCEKTGIKDVLIPYGEFYLDSTVHIKIGGIKFHGQGSLMREESWWGAMESDFPDAYEGYGDAIAYRGSNIIVKNGISGIMYDASVCDSVYWRGVSFRSKNGRQTGNTYAIDFRATWAGPTWPFNVHECFFRGFNRVFNFYGDGILFYNIAFINVTNCAFSQNDEIVYQGFHASTNTRYQTWGLIFENNKCHDNSRSIYACCSKDLVSIIHNNFEGNINYSNGSAPPNIIDLELNNASGVDFRGNHFEGVISDCVYMSTIPRNANGTFKTISGSAAFNPNSYVRLEGNNFDGVYTGKVYNLNGCNVVNKDLAAPYVYACNIIENRFYTLLLNDYAKTNGTILKYPANMAIDPEMGRSLNMCEPILIEDAKAYLDKNGEQWVRFNDSNANNNFGFLSYQMPALGPATFICSAWKIRHADTNDFYSGYEANVYQTKNGVSSTGTPRGMYHPPTKGDFIVLAMFPANYVEGVTNTFEIGLAVAFGGGANVSVNSTVYRFAQTSDLPQPIYKPMDAIGNTLGSFFTGQSFSNYTNGNMYCVTESGTKGTLTGITVSSIVSGQLYKVGISNITNIAQGQFITISGQNFRIMELNGNIATLSATPSPALNIGDAITFKPPVIREYKKAAAQIDSSVSDLGALVGDFNSLLSKLRTAGILST